MVKCSCGVSLFDCDVVNKESAYKTILPSSPDVLVIVSKSYRCPKCFETTNVRVD